MNALIGHYDRRYYAQVMGPLLHDEQYYQIKARSAAQTYFGRFRRPLGKILEYGCGIGQNIAALDDAVGFDVSEAARSECRRRGIATIDRQEDIPPRHFDYVLCRHVLEHVEHPLALVRELLNYLGDGGRLILVVPKEGHRSVPFEPDVNRHLYCWNFRTLNNLIWSAGGEPLVNRVEPMFGRRIHVPLQPVRHLFGFRAYYQCARLAGWCVNEPELVVHCRVCRREAPTVNLGDVPAAAEPVSLDRPATYNVGRPGDTTTLTEPG